MDFRKFLNQDLSVIKKELNLYILKRDKYGDSILYDLIFYNISLPKIKYIFKFCNLHCKSLFLEKNNYGSTFRRLVCYPYSHLVKYILKFYSLNFPFIFLEKDIHGSIIRYLLRYPYFYVAKFAFKFYILNFPFLFLEKDKRGNNVFYDLSLAGFCVVKYSSKFCYLNFPEISLSTNNFILPLLMEIQN